MEKQRLNFFLTCPFCQKKFRIRPETVFKYMDRLLDEIEKEFEKTKQDLEQKRMKNRT